MYKSSQSTRPVGQVLWEELFEGEGEKSECETYVILHITPLCSLLHMVLKDKCMCLQDECKLQVTCPAILKYFCPLLLI